MSNYKLVPLEPTDEMVAATGLEPIRARAAYRAMIEAAPDYARIAVTMAWKDCADKIEVEANATLKECEK